MPSGNELLGWAVKNNILEKDTPLLKLRVLYFLHNQAHGQELTPEEQAYVEKYMGRLDRRTAPLLAQTHHKGAKHNL